MRKRILVAIVLVCALGFPATQANTVDASTERRCEGGEIETVSYENLEFDVEVTYTFTFDESQKQLCVKVENGGDNDVNAGYRAVIDNRALNEPRPELQPGETLRATHNVSPWLNLYQDNHTIEVGADGNNAQFNFTHEINASSPDVPSPEISDVEVLRDKQNSSTALRVSLTNPTRRGYAFYIQATTFGTDDVYRAGAPQPNQTTHVLLPLEESADEVVAGKVRIFHKWDDTDGKYDQREFMAKPNETANSWDVSFDRVPGATADYTYHNESAEKFRAGYVDDDTLPPLQKKIGAALTVLLMAGVLWAWRRRKRR